MNGDNLMAENEKPENGLTDEATENAVDVAAAAAETAEADVATKSAEDELAKAVEAELTAEPAEAETPAETTEAEAETPAETAEAEPVADKKTEKAKAKEAKEAEKAEKAAAAKAAEAEKAEAKKQEKADKKADKKAAKAQAKADKKAAKKNRSKEEKALIRKKRLTVATYIIYFLCLMAGLFAPLYGSSSLPLTERMMIRYVPSALSDTLYKFVQKPLFESLPWFINAHVNDFSIQALAVVLYAVWCVISLIMLIPVFAGKYYKGTVRRTAFTMEAVTALIAFVYLAFHVYGVSLYTNNFDEFISNISYNMLITFGGVVLMMCIQSICYKGRVGVSKIIGLLLSGIAMLTLYNFIVYTPVKNQVANLSETIKAQFGFYAEIKSGFYYLYKINTPFAAIRALKNYSWKKITALCVLTVISALVFINCICEIIGLATSKKFNKDRTPCANKASNNFALMRYIVTFILCLCVIAYCWIDKFFLNKPAITKAGIYLYLLAVVQLISIIYAGVRKACAKSRVKKGVAGPKSVMEDKIVMTDSEGDEVMTKEYAQVSVFDYTGAKTEEKPAEQKEELEEEPVEETVEEPVEDTAAEAAEEVEETTEEPVEELAEVVTEEVEETTEETVETVAEEQPEEEAAAEEPEEEPAVYDGETDEFIETLTDKEKVEFAETFIKKSRGNVSMEDDYVVGGDNEDFFLSVFIHINRMRAICSDELLNKMYTYMNK